MLVVVFLCALAAGQNSSALWEVELADSVATCVNAEPDPQFFCAVTSVALNNDHSVVYFGTSYSGVYGINASSGETLFKSPLLGSSSTRGHTLLVTKQTDPFLIFVSPSHIPQELNESVNWSIEAINARTGMRRWSFDPSTNTNKVKFRSMVLNSDNSVVIVSATTFPLETGQIYALNASTGDIAWEHKAFKRYNLIDQVVLQQKSKVRAAVVAEPKKRGGTLFVYMLQ